MRQGTHRLAILGTGFFVFWAAWAPGGCGGGENVKRGIYEATQERQRAEDDPPRDLPPTYDEYERFRKKPATPESPALEPGR